MNFAKQLLTVATNATIIASVTAMSTLSAKAVSLRKVTDLQSITFFERSGGTSPKAYTFSIDSPRLLNRLSRLNSSSYDFSGVRTEFYDVFYSDRSGNLDINGEYLTIEGVYGYGKPHGGGLNLSEMRLNFADGSREFANLVADFTTLGNNGHSRTVENAIDGNLLTHTTMGNTIGQSDRLSVTLGFASSAPEISEPKSVPEPSSMLGLFALGGLGVRSLWKRKS
jgi:hypothetical protein